jgi:hypothetical protein
MGGMGTGIYYGYDVTDMPNVRYDDDDKKIRKFWDDCGMGTIGGDFADNRWYAVYVDAHWFGYNQNEMPSGKQIIKSASKRLMNKFAKHYEITEDPEIHIFRYRG